MTRVRFQNGKRVIEGWDRVFDALSAEPRRQLLISLSDARPDQSVPLPESACNPTVPADPESLRIELRHVHLPKLTEMGFIQWDSDPLRVSRGSNFEQVATVLEILQSNAAEIPDSLVVGCQRLEEKRQFESHD